MGQWAPERVVDAALARGLVRRQFPSLNAERVEPIGQGWDNAAYLVDGSWVFRFPQREFAVQFMQTELRVLPTLCAEGPDLGLDVPHPVHVGRPDATFPWPFAGYRLRRGQTACRARLDRQARDRAARPLARFLRALHSIRAERALALGAAPDANRRMAQGRVIDDAGTKLSELSGRGWIEGAADLERILAEAPREWSARTHCLVHGDLYARHVLVAEGGAPTAVIDWGDCHVGDPALDLSLAWSFLPPAARGAFREAYGEVDEGSWRMARARALYTLLTLVDYGTRIDDEDLAAEARTGLSFIGL